jgi:hypothetical protein
MRKRELVGWVLAAALTTAAFPALAQQDDIPILRPKSQITKPAGATLLVMCDLACNWTLDGETKGRIEAGDSAKAKVEIGQHIVIAVTEDGADKVKQFSEVKLSGQTVVSIELKHVRDARLKVEQQARDKTLQEQLDQADQEEERKEATQVVPVKATREQQERERVARELAAPTWTDRATGLMWAKKDNGSDVNWQQATVYCRNLQLDGHSGWRLPMIDELEGIVDQNADVGGYHVKGNLQLSNAWQWSNSQGNAVGEVRGYAWAVNFYHGGMYLSLPQGVSSGRRALCVRRSGE